MASICFQTPIQDGKCQLSSPKETPRKTDGLKLQKLPRPATDLLPLYTAYSFRKIRLIISLPYVHV